MCRPTVKWCNDTCVVLRVNTDLIDYTFGTMASPRCKLIGQIVRLRGREG